jgi:thiosulfate/3-mercaptopyruvate sulfurtransferase
LLDGGLAAWTAAGLPVEAVQPVAPVARQFAPRPFTGWLTSAEVAAALERHSLLLIDARAADRFAGQNEVVDPVAGHVPGALNRPFIRNVAADGHWLPAAELRAQWQALLGAQPHDEVASMCGSGVTACHHLFALELAGLASGARLYAGSFSEWIADPARPVATGAPAAT